MLAIPPLLPGTPGALALRRLTAEPRRRLPARKRLGSSPPRDDGASSRWSPERAPDSGRASLAGATTIDGAEVDLEDGAEGLLADPACSGSLGPFEARKGPRWEPDLQGEGAPTVGGRTVPGPADGARSRRVAWVDQARRAAKIP